MDYEVEIVPKLTVKPIKSQLADPRTAPDTMPDRPFIGAVVASRGGGKTTSIINFVKIYASSHFFDKVYLLSPTFHNDPKLETLQDDRYDLRVYTEVNFDTVDEILDEIKSDINQYKKYKEYIKVWKRFMKAKSPEDWLDRADPADIALLQEHDFQPPDTPWEYGMPQSLIICDDLVGNRAIYNNPALVRFLLVHRHWLTSVLFSVQVWKGALPRGIRNNLSLLMLFCNKSIQIRKEIAEELASHISPDHFMLLWDYACQEPHDFFTINFDDPKHRFRRNLNEIIKIKSVPISKSPDVSPEQATH